LNPGVYVDGNLVGYAPCTVCIASGAHTVALDYSVMGPWDMTEVLYAVDGCDSNGYVYDSATVVGYYMIP
jgi:hypothetical protein